MRTFLRTFVISVSMVALAAPALPAVIDFEAQSAGRGGVFTGGLDSPLTIDVATFTGGELLRGEVGLSANQTGVYATWLFTSGATNPLVITFSTPVTGFSVQVFNGGESQNYTVSSNLGESIVRSIGTAGSGGSSTFALAGALTRVEVLGASAGFNFAIDNVTYGAVPEPGTAGLLAAATCLLVIWRFSGAGFRRGLSTPPR